MTFAKTVARILRDMPDIPTAGDAYTQRAARHHVAKQFAEANAKVHP